MLEPVAVPTSTIVLTHTRRVQAKHHWLVRGSHWLNIPLLLGLSLSGLSIYWASPVHMHRPDPATGNNDYLSDIGIWLCAHVWFLRGYTDPSNWVYNHLSLGPAMLAQALRLHWLFAYLFMLNGALYVAGLLLGGGWRSLLARKRDVYEAFSMARYYALRAVDIIWRTKTQHPATTGKYNALQRSAYASVGFSGFLSVLTGWAIHKPVQLWWIAAAFGGYNAARVWHFWLMIFFLLFTVPHVGMVLADGWDTIRSMITGWSERVDQRDE